MKTNFKCYVEANDKIHGAFVSLGCAFNYINKLAELPSYRDNLASINLKLTNGQEYLIPHALIQEAKLNL